MFVNVWVFVIFAIANLIKYSLKKKETYRAYEKITVLL